MNIKDLKVGDELECINIDAYLNHNNGAVRGTREIILTKQLIIGSVKSDGVGICNTNFRISDDMLKFFKKAGDDLGLESKKGLFNSLIEYASIAAISGDIKICFLSDSAIRFVVKNHAAGYEFDLDSHQESIEKGIDLIQSLQKERFVIECLKDIEKIKVGAEIQLLNGNIINVLSNNGAKVQSSYTVDALSLVSLQGATVEQSK